MVSSCREALNHASLSFRFPPFQNMKTLLVSSAIAGLLGASVLGIPQTFQSNQFLVGTGLAFEDFAVEPATWADNSGLKGRWEAHGESLTLLDTAAVFGIPADEVSALVRDGYVQSFRVVFRDKEKQPGANSKDLLGLVTSNIWAYTRDAGTNVAGGGKVFHHKRVTITLRANSPREVVVEFTHG